MSKEHIVSYSLNEIREKLARGESRSDWARVDALTDEDIRKAIAEDHDAASDDLDVACRANLAAYKCPRVIEYVGRDGRLRDRWLARLLEDLRCAATKVGLGGG